MGIINDPNFDNVRATRGGVKRFHEDCAVNSRFLDHDKNVHWVALVRRCHLFELDDDLVWHILSFHVDNPFFLLTVSHTWKGARKLIAKHMKAKVQVVSTPCFRKDCYLRAICITRYNPGQPGPSQLPGRPSQLPARVSITRHFHPMSDWDAEIWFLLRKIYVFHFRKAVVLGKTPGARWLPISPAILLNKYRLLVNRAIVRRYPHGFTVNIKYYDRPTIYTHVRKIFIPNKSKLLRVEPTTSHYEHFMVPRTKIHNDLELWSMDSEFPSLYTWIDNKAGLFQLNHLMQVTEMMNLEYQTHSIPRLPHFSITEQ